MLNSITPQSPLSLLDKSNIKQLSETHSTAQIHQSYEKNQSLNDCPSCRNKTNKISYYSCCLSPSCDNCYSGFHYLQCEKKSRMTIIDIDKKQDQRNRNSNNLSKNCQRCDNIIQDYGYSCQQCRICVYCSDCFTKMHNSTKFKSHSYKKWHKSFKLSDSKTILTCSTHNKLRTILTQSSQLLCPDCCSLSRSKRYKSLDLQSPNFFQLTKQNLSTLSSDINMRNQNHKAKWFAIRNQLLSQYTKISTILSQKYEQNIHLLLQMQQYDMKTIQKARQLSQKILNESKIKYETIDNNNPVISARMSLLQQQLMKIRHNIDNNQLFIYKIGNVDMEKLQVAIKTFNINKLKLRENDDKQKQNMSIRKANNSIQKPHASNLSLSRRSLSKSISKIDNVRTSGLKQSIYSVNRSQNLSQHVSTQPIRNSTPPHSTQPINSSDKKSALLRQSSIMTAKLQDITPVILNFDMKQSAGSRINFLSNKTEKVEDQNCLTEINPNNQSSQSRVSKRKSDYFQLRQRMRKPTAVNNRFSNTNKR